MSSNECKIVLKIFIVALILNPFIFGFVNMFSRSEYETTQILSETQRSFNYCHIFVDLKGRNLTNIGIRIPCSAMNPSFVGQKIDVCYYHFGHPDPRLKEGFFEGPDHCSQVSFSTSWQLLIGCCLFTYIGIIGPLISLYYPKWISLLDEKS